MVQVRNWRHSMAEDVSPTNQPSEPTQQNPEGSKDVNPQSLLGSEGPESPVFRTFRTLETLQGSGSDSSSPHFQTFSRGHRRNVSDFSKASDRRNSPDGLQVRHLTGTTKLEVPPVAPTVLLHFIHPPPPPPSSLSPSHPTGLN